LEEDTMAKALDGHWREEHLLVLAEAVALSEVTQLLRRCSPKISAVTNTMIITHAA
jgi:hypothetical protein